jgi:hypothetical protein
MTDSVVHVYDIHGVELGVDAVDRAVIEAIDLRLRDFRSEPRSDPELRFEFVSDGQDESAPPAGLSRPVYDTPCGSLHYFPEADAVYGQLGGVWLHCEPARGVAVFRSASFVGRELYLATHPLATISLMELLERRGLFSLHAACLSDSTGSGVLLAGPSGSGKSTLALSLARAGMSFLADDVVFLAQVDDAATVRVLGFADAVGLTSHLAQRFGELRESLAEAPADGFPKRLRRIEHLLGAPALRSCEPRALVFPEVALEELSELAPLDPREALLMLVPDVLLTEPSATQAHLRAIAALLDQVGCYTLRSGNDLERATALVSRLV